VYPRNAASPEPIAIGAVVQISDGAVQTSGVTVRIKPVGVAESDGAGTVAYSTDGVVYYTPTQAETNYTSFILIAKKTSCIPVAITVVTSASATAGQVRLEGVTHTSAVIPTVTTVTNKTGYELSGTGVAAVQSGLATQTSVDDIPTVSEFNARTLPNADYFVVGDYTAPPTVNAIADQVWDEAQADHLNSGSMGFWVNAIASATAPLVTMIELVGVTYYRFKANALEVVGDKVDTLLGRVTATLFNGITSLGDWIRRIARKDAGTAGMGVAETEIDTGGTSTFTGTTDNLESIKDAGGGGGGGGTVNITVEDRSITLG
jgi:hypothetical protein